VYEGEDCFLRLQNDILNTLKNSKNKEVLLIGNDDSKSTEKIIEKDKELYESGILFKNLIALDNNYILGPLEDYRQIDSKFFIPNNLTIIYDGKVAFDLCEDNEDIEKNKILVLKEKKIHNRMKDYFYNLWCRGIELKHSKVKQVFLKKG